ncbi:MAG: SRPBCC domain-containing protein [Pseudomonadota bacterium]
MNDVPTYLLERVFDAPRDLVWRTWTEPDLLARWYGPNVETVIHRLEATPGGLWLVEMKWGGNSKYERVEYTEVDPPKRLEWLQSAADSDFNPASNPMMPDWPRVLHTVVTFEEIGNKTKLRLVWTPFEATDAELACFAGAIANLDKGWGAGMAILEQLLADLQA